MRTLPDSGKSGECSFQVGIAIGIGFEELINPKSHLHRFSIPNPIPIPGAARQNQSYAAFGLIFWFTRKKFVGSYLALTAASRSKASR